MAFRTPKSDDAGVSLPPVDTTHSTSDPTLHKTSDDADSSRARNAAFHDAGATQSKPLSSTDPAAKPQYGADTTQGKPQYGEDGKDAEGKPQYGEDSRGPDGKPNIDPNISADVQSGAIRLPDPTPTPTDPAQARLSVEERIARLERLLRAQGGDAT